MNPLSDSYLEAIVTNVLSLNADKVVPHRSNSESSAREVTVSDQLDITLAEHYNSTVLWSSALSL